MSNKITKTFNYNKGGINTNYTGSIFLNKNHGRPTLKFKFEDISLLKNEDFFEDFYTNIEEELIEVFDCSEKYMYMLIPNGCEIDTSTALFIDCYYPNLYDEDYYLTGDNEIGKNIVGFDDMCEKNELEFDLGALYYHNEVPYKDEYEEMGFILNRVKKEFYEMLLDEALVYAI